jgi:hypothetical protein
VFSTCAAEKSLFGFQFLFHCLSLSVCLLFLLLFSAKAGLLYALSARLQEALESALHGGTGTLD